MNDLRVMPARMLAALIALLLAGCTAIEAQPAAYSHHRSQAEESLLRFATALRSHPM